MSRGKTLVLVLAGALASAQTPAGDRILGLWSTEDGQSKVEIVKCGDAYCGSIKWMVHPKNDQRNPDASLRGRPLVGAQILSGVRYSGADTWAGGSIYGPERGKDGTPKLVLTSAGALEIRVTAGIARKTITWNRAK